MAKDKKTGGDVAADTGAEAPATQPAPQGAEAESPVVSESVSAQQGDGDAANIDAAAPAANETQADLQGTGQPEPDKPALKVLSQLNHDGVFYAIGSAVDLDLFSERQVEELIRLGIVETTA